MMRKLQFLYILIFCLSSTVKLYAQNTNVISENGRFLVTYSTDKQNSREHLITLYHIEKKIPLVKVNIECGTLTKLSISPDGKSIAIRTVFETFVIDALSGKVILKLPSSNEIIFANSDHLFFVNGPKLTAHSSITGLPSVIYQNSKETDFGYRKIYISKDDKYIIAITQGKGLKLWKMNESKLIKTLSCLKGFYNPEKNNVILFKGSKVYTYNVPFFNLVSSFDLVKEFEKFAVDYKSKNGKSILFTYKNSFPTSIYGSYICNIYRDNREKKLVFFNTSTGEITESDFETGKKNITSLKWVSDDHFIVQLNNKKHFMIDVESKNNILTLKKGYYNQSIIFQNTDILYYVQNNRIHFESLQSKSAYEIKEADFHAVSNDCKTVIALNKKKNLGVITLDNLNPSEFIPFKDSIVPIHDIQFDDSDTIMNLNYITSFKHISERKIEDGKINIVQKSVVSKDSVLQIQIHLISENGVYYYGFADENNKHLWCNLLIAKNNKEYNQVLNFNVHEYTTYNKNKIAYAIVMDHSGSMSDSKAKKLQKAVLRCIENKHKEDGYTILKYDNKIGVVSDLDSNRKKVTSKIEIIGLEGYGNATSLLDATNAAISLLKNAKGYDELNVIIMTDGNENSSMITGSEVVERANSYEVKVHTLGYGFNVDKNFLKNLSKYTGGTFYRVFSSNQFEEAFDDIEKKTNNYYAVNIPIDESGVYNIIMQLCVGEEEPLTSTFTIDSKLTSKGVTIDLNYKSDKDSLTTKDSLELKKVIETHPKITDFSQIVFEPGPIAPIIKKEEIEHEVPIVNIDYSEIDDEFSKLVFPNIKFVFNSTTVIKNSDLELNQLISFLKKYPTVCIEVGGHTDNIGDQDYNVKLSDERAFAIKQKMVDLGIESNRIRAVGYGDRIPLVENDTEENRTINRRIDFTLELICK